MLGAPRATCRTPAPPGIDETEQVEAERANTRGCYARALSSSARLEE
jgi:hypothetical protein